MNENGLEPLLVVVPGFKLNPPLVDEPVLEVDAEGTVNPPKPVKLVGAEGIAGAGLVAAGAVEFDDPPVLANLVASSYFLFSVSSNDL